MPITADSPLSRTGHGDLGLAEIRLWQLISPGLPVGAYAYSQGLETAVDMGWVWDLTSTAEWLDGVLSHTVARLDVPVLARLYRAWEGKDMSLLRHWSAYLLASRETFELRAEERHLGTALGRLLADLETPGMAASRKEADTEVPVTFVSMFALAAREWRISLAAAARGLLWTWLENQTLAAIKLVPLGQTQGQRLLWELGSAVPRLAAAGLALDDAELGASLPGLQIASMGHETQHTRLFRS